VEEYLTDILQAIERATRYVDPLKDAVMLARNDQVHDAVVRNIEIIGEAVSRILTAVPEFASRHPETPWTEIRRMRNKLIHEYSDIDWNVVWDTVREDLPALKRQVESLLAENG
jgi:uncharacterized protein with HEPN domain